MNHSTLAGLGLLLLSLTACADAADPSAAPADTAAPGALTTIPSPALPGSSEPRLSVSEHGVLLSWIEQRDDRVTLKFAERTAKGWSDARTVASGDDWFVNWADAPSVVRLADGTLVGHWLEKSGADTYAYDVRLSYSRDDGRAWSPSLTPHHDGTQTEHGFASLFEMPGAGLGLIWLDGRGMAGGHEADGGAMSVRFALFDTAFTQTTESAIDLRACECCPTAAAVTSDGPIAAFRDRSGDEVRDIVVSRFDGQRWSEPAVVHADGWQIAACPVNGPALAARGRSVAVAWFTVKDDQGQAYVAFSQDAGRSFGPPTRVDDGGSLGRVDVALLDDGSAMALWIELTGERAEVRARRIAPSGERSAPVTIAGVARTRASGYPRMARHGGELVFAWTEVAAGGDRQVRTAVLSK